MILLSSKIPYITTKDPQTTSYLQTNMLLLYLVLSTQISQNFMLILLLFHLLALQSAEILCLKCRVFTPGVDGTIALG